MSQPTASQERDFGNSPMHNSLKGKKNLGPNIAKKAKKTFMKETSHPRTEKPRKTLSGGKISRAHGWAGAIV